MKNIILTILTSLIICDVAGQNVKITTDSLLHHLQHAENIYACFDYQTEDSVVGNFNACLNQKELYFNDCLKHILINLFNDSIGWTKYTAKKVRRNLEAETNNYKHNALSGYLEDKYNKAFADSVFKDDNLLSQYFDSLCAFEEEQSFKEDIGKIGYWNVPNSLCNILSYSHFPEIYDKMYYYWKRKGCSQCGFYYDYLLNVDCPDVISKMETMLDSNEWSMDLESFLNRYNSESIRLMIKAMNKTFLVQTDLDDFIIPFNVYCFGFMWLSKYADCYRYNHYKNESEKKTFKIMDKIWRLIEFAEPKPSKESWLRISNEIIDNKQYIGFFLEEHYKKCLEQELYWKQNMPYYKKEVIEHEDK